MLILNGLPPSSVSMPVHVSVQVGVINLFNENNIVFVHTIFNVKCCTINIRNLSLPNIHYEDFSRYLSLYIYAILVKTTLFEQTDNAA